MSDKASVELADPALGNDTARARDLLFRGADISHDFYAAAQNAAANGNADVLKLVLAADSEFHETKQDAMRTAGRAGRFAINELLIDSSGRETNASRQVLHAQFIAAKHTNDRAAADQALNDIMALMFPRSPRADWII